MQKEPVWEFQEFHLNQFSRESKEYSCHTLVKKNHLSFSLVSHNFIAKIFLMNWTWISHFTQDNKDFNHTDGIRTHAPKGRSVTNSLQRMTGKESQTLPQHKWSSMVDRHQNQLAKYPQCSQTVLNGRQMSEPIGKNAQIALHAHKQPSMADRHQNQLARTPK